MLILPGVLIGLVGFFAVQLCPPVLEPFYVQGFVVYMGILALCNYFFFIAKDKFYPLSNPNFVLLLFVLATLGAQALGGIYEQWNLAGLIFVCAVGGLNAKPLAALGGWALAFVSLAMQSMGLFNGLLENVGLGLESPVSQLPIFPAISSLVVLGLSIFTAQMRIKILMKMDYSRIRDTQTISKKVFSPKNQPELIINTEEDKSDTGNATQQIFTKEYAIKQNEKSLSSLKDVLNSVVYFMSKNFKAYSSMGFLYNESTKSLHLNAAVSSSDNFNRNVNIKLGEGMVGKAFSNPEGFLSGDLKNYPDSIEYYTQNSGINSICIMPIKDLQTKRTLGLLVVDSQNLRAFTDVHRDLLKKFAEIAAAMVSNVILTKQVSFQAKWADTLYEVTRSLNQVQKVEDVMAQLIEVLPKIFSHTRIVICIYNSKSKKAQMWNVMGDSTGLKRGLEFEIKNEKSLYGTVFTKRTQIIMENYPQKGKDFYRFNENIDSIIEKPQDVMIVPLFDDKQAVVAVIGLESNQQGSYSEKELRSLDTLMVNFSTALGKARAYGELEKLATIDGLTQVPNHRKFQDVLSTEMHRTQRYKEQLTLLLMDIDHFKNFNDTYGHPVGDAVLKQVAKTIQKTIRGTDMVARYGGEEFVVIMIKADEEHSRLLAERICRAIEDMEVKYDNKVLKVTVSIGSATFPRDVQTKQELIDAADQAMYYSKEHGRNQVNYYSQVKPELEKKS